MAGKMGGWCGFVGGVFFVAFALPCAPLALIMRRPLYFYFKQFVFCQAKVLVESFEGHEWALELTVWADFLWFLHSFLR